jgi:hypothetical protein
MIDEIYHRFRYGRSIDYGKPLVPRLADAEVAWLRKRLVSKRS